MQLCFNNCYTDLFQGHIGENPFDNGSWGKEHFQPSTVPWQLNPRGHSRPSVSVFIIPLHIQSIDSQSKTFDYNHDYVSFIIQISSKSGMF